MSKLSHSIKVPTQYKATAKILKQALEKQTSIKTLIFTEKHAVSRLRKSQKRATKSDVLVFLHSQRVSSLQAVLKSYSDNRGAIDNAIEETGLLRDNPRLDSALAKVLVTEIIYGRGQLNGESKPVQTVREYKERLQQALGVAGVVRKKGRCSPHIIDISIAFPVAVLVSV